MAGINLTGQAFIGEWASKYWMPNIFEGNTISSGVVNVQDGIKSDPGLLIGTIDFVGRLQARQAKPSTPIGAWNIGNKYLSPKPAMLYTEFNPATFEGHWENVNLSDTMLSRKLPATIESYMMYMMMGRIFQEDLETGWWMSSTDYAGLTDETDPRIKIQFFDGFMKLLVNDGTVLNYASPATITTSNVLTFMDGLIDLIAINKKGLITKFGRMKFLMNPKTWQIWRKAMVASTYKGINFDQQAYKEYAGYGIEVLNGFPDNTLIFAECAPDLNGAFHIGVNSTEDENQIQMDRTRIMDETYFVKALLKMGIQTKFGNEIAMMTTLTAASFTI